MTTPCHGRKLSNFFHMTHFVKNRLSPFVSNRGKTMYRGVHKKRTKDCSILVHLGKCYWLV